MAEEGYEVRGKLDLEGLVLRLRLGVLPQEKVSCRDVPVNLSWTGSFDRSPPVDYSEVCEKLAVIQDRDYDYIEDLAAEILDILCREYRRGRWTVRVVKPCPPAGLRLQAASFEIEGGEEIQTGGDHG